MNKMKLDELRIMVGLETDLDALLKAKPGSKESQIIKLYKEANERAETLGKLNRDLEKKQNELMDTLETLREERTDLERNYIRKLGNI